MIAAITADLDTMTRGFGRPVHDAQQTFRRVLDAMSRPGRIVGMPEEILQTAQAPMPATVGKRSPQAATTAILLTLLDAETSARLHGSLDDDALWRYLRFHTGLRRPDAFADTRSPAAFDVWAAEDVPAPVWSLLEAGSDEIPEQGSTLIVEVPHLHSQPSRPHDLCLALRGPGVEDVQRLAVAGLSVEFWRERIAMESLFPRGVDLVLVCGARLAAIPRSTHVALES